MGYSVLEGEPLKITISSKSYGYTGNELSRLLYMRGVVSEFSDEDFLVLMPSCDTADTELDALLSALSEIPQREPIFTRPPILTPPLRAVSPREAIFSPCEEVAVECATGRVLAAVTLSCPPAVPILVSGEVVNKEAVSVFKYYGVEKIKVIK